MLTLIITIISDSKPITLGHDKIHWFYNIFCSSSSLIIQALHAVYSMQAPPKQYFFYFFHKVQRPNLINLNRVSERPISGSNCALAQILKHWFKFYVEQTKFEPRLMMYKFVEFGLISDKTAELQLKIGPVQALFRPRSGLVLWNHDFE